MRTRYSLFILVVILCSVICGCSKNNEKNKTTSNETKIVGKNGERKSEQYEPSKAVFEADFSGKYPSNKQFYSWEGRQYGGAVFQPLKSIKCENNTAILTSVKDKETGLQKQQMMCTAGLFESDNFVCEFEAKFDGTPGSWSYVITYGTGTYWTNNVYSDGLKWPAGGEIDVFEQAGGYSENPTNFKTPSIHYGTGSTSEYPDHHLAVIGDNVEFETNKWHKFKFSLKDGIIREWIDDVLVGEDDFSQYTVSNNCLYEYHPFLNPQAFYIGCQSADGEKSKTEYEFQIKNFKVVQDDQVECQKLEIYPQMWTKNTELIFPVNANLYLQREYYPSNTSNKACKWESSDESVAKVVEGYVTTIGEGTTQITATCGDAVATYTLNVSSDVNIPCAGVEANYDKISVRMDHSKDIKYYLYPDFSTDVVEISTLDKKIATVSNSILYGQAVGETELLVKCGKKTQTIKVSVKENNKKPFAEYNLIEATDKIGMNAEEKGYASSAVVTNLGEDGKKLNLTAEYATTQMIIENEWKETLDRVTLKTPVIDEVKELTRYPSMYLLKASSGSVRTNSSNGNIMPSIDVSRKGIIVRYGGANIYQTDANGEDTHAIAIYIQDGHSSVFVDGKKVIDDGTTTYINNLSQLILTTSKKKGIEYFAAYEDCEFTDEELITMTQI